MPMSVLLRIVMASMIVGYVLVKSLAVRTCVFWEYCGVCPPFWLANSWQLLLLEIPQYAA